MGEQDLCDPNLSSGNLLMLEVDAGLTIHRLERQGLNVAYYHASPGTGTRVASIDLKPLRIKQEMLFFTLVWSPQEIALYLGGADRNNQFIFLSGKGNPSKRKFRVAVDGSIIEFGNEKSTFTSIYVHENGKYLLRPTALEAWEETVSGINVLLNGEGDPSAHALFEVVAVNMTFAMLVTGLETFTKRRFLELEDEGIHPNFEALAAKVLIPIRWVDVIVYKCYGSLKKLSCRAGHRLCLMT